MKKATIIIMAILALSLGLEVQAIAKTPQSSETDVVEVPTKKK